MLKKKILTTVAVVLAVVVLTGSGFWWGYHTGTQTPEHIIVSGVSNINGSTTTNADFGEFWQVWQTINTDYLHADQVTNQQRVYGAIQGMVASLNDPYSEFFPPAESQTFQQTVTGNFGGVGIELGMVKEQLVVIAPLKGSPADQAGIKAGDEIVTINASSTATMTIDQAVALIRGPVNTTVKLGILRGTSTQEQDFTITRQNIEVPTLDFSMKDGDIADFQLYGFNANAPQLFQQDAQKAIASGAKGMILDLRGDPGGYLDVAVNLAGWLLPKGTLVVSEQGRQGTLATYRADGTGALDKLPLVVLIDGGSASASEILAGALRDDRQVPLIGQQSFGKGVVQELEQLPDGSSLKLTIAHWVLPNGGILENGGLKPDYAVTISDTDAKNNVDPQLNKALQVVQSEIK